MADPSDPYPQHCLKAELQQYFNGFARMTKISYNHAKVPATYSTVVRFTSYPPFARLTGTSPNSVNLHIHLWNDFNNKAGSFVR